MPDTQLGFSNRNQPKNYTCWFKLHQTNLRLQSNNSGTLWWIVFITHVTVSWLNINNIFETYYNKKAFISKASLIYVEAIQCIWDITSEQVVIAEIFDSNTRDCSDDQSYL